jgi:hypothetical protein
MIVMDAGVNCVEELSPDSKVQAFQVASFGRAGSIIAQVEAMYTHLHMVLAQQQRSGS